VEDSLEAFRSELAEIRKEINVEIISSLIEELDAAGTDSASSRGELNCRSGGRSRWLLQAVLLPGIQKEIGRKTVRPA
jgi:hypothetical protein